jgi:hypothetical protein
MVCYFVAGMAVASSQRLEPQCTNGLMPAVSGTATPANAVYCSLCLSTERHDGEDIQLESAVGNISISPKSMNMLAKRPPPARRLEGV